MIRSLLVLALALAPALAGCSESTARPPADDDPQTPPTGNHAFTYAPPAAAPGINTISVRGSFNDWNAAAMQRQSDGSWLRRVDLPDGTTQYKYVINGEWVNDMCWDPVWGDPDRDYVVDPDADGCTSDGFQGRNAVVVLGDVPLDFRHSPASPADLSVAAGRLSVRFRARSGQVERPVLVTGGDTIPMHRQLELELQETWRASIPEGISSYAIVLQHADTTAAFGPYDVPASLFRSVDWVGSAVGYQIFPERFWNGDPSNDTLALTTDEYLFWDPELGGSPPILTRNWGGAISDLHCCHQYFGGDLQGIIDRLGQLEALGITALYLNPVFLAGSAHGYDTYDYLEVAPNFGDSTLLRTLLDQAHGRGMRVIWDFVPNHVGVGHWAFQDAVENGEASPYWDWFEFRVPADSVQVGNGEHYEAWWGYGSLPELQTRNAEVMDHLLAVAEHWTRFGFDGIRVDVPNELENRSQFFPAWRDAVKALDPDHYLVGEIWERDPSWIRGDQFDALMNYTLGQGVVEPFARGEMSGPVALRELADIYARYPEASVAMSFNLIASHDTDRLLTMLSGEEMGGSATAGDLARHRLAAAILYAVPGMPMTFQGDECGFLGGSGGNHSARYPVQWDACDTGLRDFYAELASLRSGLPALGGPAWRAGPEARGLLAFYRGEPGPDEVLALFNPDPGAVQFELPDGSWTDARTSEAMTATTTVDGLGWRYLVRE